MILQYTTDEYAKALDICRREKPDFLQAHDLLVEAKKMGDLRATYALATWYLNGNDFIERDEKKGVSLLKSLETSNIPEALFDLAVSYDYGKFVRKNQKKAFSLYMRAALLGDTASCDQLSQYYSEGKIVPYDMKLAEAWKLRSKQMQENISPPYRLKLL
ncbi:tetratricopeptide repeat protein [Sphingopyxis sp.]|jgi:TPR repeat protein|uniref:tetratricopeptide repeat protein n=1 Tax=Sphingopyxis sp. TaxID=1908224 RepID=UPI003F730A15